MTAETIERLQQLARTDATIAPLARLQAVTLRAAGEAAWEEGVPAFERARLDDGLPLLHGATIAVDLKRVSGLSMRLAEQTSPPAPPLRGEGRHTQPRPPRDLPPISGDGGLTQPRPLKTPSFLAAEGRDTEPRRDKAPPPRAGEGAGGRGLLEASITQDAARLEELAAEAGMDPALLMTLGQLTALPLLLACGRKAAPLVEQARWEEGYCPVCVAWPALAEARGLARRRWLRCGRCGTGWSLRHEGCAFCGNTDFRTLGYLAPEKESESRRAMVCERCRGYLKTFTTLAPLAPAEIGVYDVTSLELDMAALEHGYARPERPGFPLQVRVEPARRRFGWSGWRR